jgi:hypothetical protein
MTTPCVCLFCEDVCMNETDRIGVCPECDAAERAAMAAGGADADAEVRCHRVEVAV